MKILNLYAGIGGNRKLWEGDIQVTAVEYNSKIASIYSSLHPEDEMIIGDAHEYLLDNHQYFDLIWSSPPCQSHSRMIRSGKNRKPRYADLRLYEEIMLMINDFKGRWVVENVIPYYRPLIEPTVKIGRHLLWSNFNIKSFDIPSPKNFINISNTAGSEKLKKWLGIHYEGNVYYEGNHDPCQILRNCVHPEMGLHVFKSHLLHL